MSFGSRAAAKDFRNMLESRFEIKTSVIGSKGTVAAVHGAATGGVKDEEVSEARVLKRIIRYTPDGWDIEAG